MTDTCKICGHPADVCECTQEAKVAHAKAELLLAESKLDNEARSAGPGVSIEKRINVNQDYIVLGAPTSGQIKVYGDASRPQTWGNKIEVTQRILADARAREAEAKAAAKPEKKDGA